MSLLAFDFSGNLYDTKPKKKKKNTHTHTHKTPDLLRFLSTSVY